MPRIPADWPADAVELGHIGEAWGLAGWFRVQPFAADPQALLAARRWHLQPREGGQARSAARSPQPAPAAHAPRARDLPSGMAAVALPDLPARLEITRARRQGDALVAKARGIDERSAAEVLRGARIFVSRADFPAAAPDEYYWADLIGLAVVNRQGVRLGSVSGLLDTGPQSVLRVQPDAPAEPDAAADEVLIPFVAAYIDAVSVAARRIDVDWEADY